MSQRKARRKSKSTSQTAVPVKKKPYLSQADAEKMLQTCAADQSRGRKAGVRDAAIIALLSETDFDIEQIVALKQSDFDVHLGAFHDHPALPQLAKDCLIRWLNARSGIKGDSLFLALSLYGDFSNKGIASRKVIADMLEDRAKQAGLSDFSFLTDDGS